MTLVSITLSEEEQQLLLMSPYNQPVESPLWFSLAEKIRRARDTKPWEPVRDDKWTGGPDKGTPYWSGDPVKFPGPGGP